MIFGRLLFDRDAISREEHSMVRAANKTALNMYKHRYDKDLRYEWDIPVDDVTLKFVEDAVIESIKNSFEKIKGTLCLNVQDAHTNRVNPETRMEINREQCTRQKTVSRS